MVKHTIFIADIHLQETEPAKAELFLQFLKKEALHADTVYILGDLFDVWIGDDDVSAFNTKTKAAIKKCATQTPICFLPGNRDFLIGPKFATDTGCKIIKDLSKIDLYDIPTIITHGDILCTNDILHFLFCKFARNPICKKLFLLFPLKLRRTIAQFIRKISRGGSRTARANIRTAQKKFRAPTKSTIKIMKKYNAKQIIHGHFHTAKVSELDNKKIISLGAWENDVENILIYYQDHTYKFL